MLFISFTAWYTCPWIFPDEQHTDIASRPQRVSEWEGFPAWDRCLLWTYPCSGQPT